MGRRLRKRLPIVSVIVSRLSNEDCDFGWDSLSSSPSIVGGKSDFRDCRELLRLMGLPFCRPFCINISNFVFALSLPDELEVWDCGASAAIVTSCCDGEGNGDGGGGEVYRFGYCTKTAIFDGMKLMITHDVTFVHIRVNHFFAHVEVYFFYTREKTHCKTQSITNLLLPNARYLLNDR
ncbi:hypothetical protein NE237_032975 [Protea cynaroides]|uniref:Uncharacterized protein n=1 Tax=Protea cynaroides TaxID=273540 RepID=A0A9Q0R3K8_9MAGN|nr:hypothetical protein NE237_032975 [Protea cynaroides]